MRLILAAALLAASAPAAAQTLYAGFDGGYDKAGAGAGSGLAWGAAIGADTTVLPTIFVGGELNGTFGRAKDCDNGVTVAGDRACVSARSEYGLVGKAGVAVPLIGRVYGLAGYTRAKYRTSYTATGASAATLVSDDTLDGYRLGAGVEVPFLLFGYIRAEYRYSNYEGGVNRSQILGGVGIRF